jgi:hypothetical protein
MLASSVVDRGYEPWSSQSKDYEIVICCFSAKHAALMSKSKDWLAWNQNNVAEWGDMSITGLNWSNNVNTCIINYMYCSIHVYTTSQEFDRFFTLKLYIEYWQFWLSRQKLSLECTCICIFSKLRIAMSWLFQKCIVRTKYDIYMI